MLGSALYFPHIDIDDPAWLRSAILFWDDIQTIAPSSIEQPYRNSDTKICEAEGYLKPLRCDLHPDVIDDLGQKVMSLSNRNAPILRAFREKDHPAGEAIDASEGFSWELNSAFEMMGLQSDKMSPELRSLVFHFGLSWINRNKIPPELSHFLHDFKMARMHPNKLPYALRRALEFDRHYRDEDGDWLLVDGRFADAYMAAMASRLAKAVELSPLTSSEPSQGLSFRFLFDDVIENSKQNATGALVSLAMRGLTVDASVPVESLIKFRRNRKDQYIEMAQKLSEFSAEISECCEESDGRALLAKAQTTYDNKVEPQLRALKRELDNNSIQTVWEGAFRALTVSVPSAGALNFFTGLTGGALLGAGALLTIADVGVRSYLVGRKSRGGNPFSYLHDIRANFGLPETQGV
ncbi:hypothetical protein [Novosphingopyxis iocasae]|uniref:hypothetical protein n=1 Tax=Novosphingopyxis iocasae TaxID=2762729 RepID=UPI001651217C|nr:hypothetical protein [Novosphingopyxis iocasae]